MRRHALHAGWCALLALCAGCAGSPRAEGEAMDHLVLAISDLQRGVDELEGLTGVRAAYGGEHGQGHTHNSLMSLGDDVYLEVLAPRAGVELPGELAGLRSVERLTPVAWAVATTGAERTIATLEAAGYKTSVPRPGSRVKPDGSTLAWRTFGITHPAMAMAPFFIQWDIAATAHPARTSPGGCSLASVTVATPGMDDLARLLALLDLPVTAVTGGEDRMAVTLRCSGRLVQLGGVPE